MILSIMLSVLLIIGAYGSFKEMYTSDHKFTRIKNVPVGRSFSIIYGILIIPIPFMLHFNDLENPIWIHLLYIIIGIIAIIGGLIYQDDKMNEKEKVDNEDFFRIKM
jgi:protein-S-isoprenylcysteine O-methyltransferase Ste14